MSRVLAASVCLIPIFAFANPSFAEDEFLYSRPRAGVMLRTRQAEDLVVYNQGPHVAPRISPDGTRVLFNSLEVAAEGQAKAMGVWLAGRDGQRKERICDGAQATWHPSGAKFAYQREGRIIEHVLDSGEEAALTPDGAPPLSFPSYMPGGGIVCVDAAGRHVYLVPQADAPLEELLEGEFHCPPRCSPDGGTLAFQDGAHIFLMDTGTRTVRQLTVEPGVQSWPAWSTDGQSLCYTRALSPYAGTWDICHVPIVDPLAATRIQRRVHPAFDWNGLSPEPSQPKPGLGATLAVWLGEKPLALSKNTAMATRKGWERIPAGSSLGPVDGHVAIENDWLILDLSRKGVFIVAKGETLAPMALCVDGGIAAIQSVRVSGDTAELTALCQGRENREALASIAVPRARPFIEVRPIKGVERIALEAGMELAVVPERLANDVLIDAGDAPPGAMIALPKTPVALGCLADAGAMVMVIAPSDMQSLAAAVGRNGKRLSSIDIAPAGGRVVFAVLAGGRAWQRPEVARSGGRWGATWEKPFAAEWRLAVRSADAACSRMWNARDLTDAGRRPLRIEEAFAEDPGLAAMYVWGRDAYTPPSVITPSDILLDVLGIGGCAAALDLEGIRGYRLANEQSPFLELTTRDGDWQPWTAYDEMRDFGLLDIMAAGFPAGTDGTRSFLTYLGNEALDMLRALDSRIGEYEGFFADFERFSADRQDVADQGCLASVRKSVAGAGKAKLRLSVSRVNEALDDMLAILGTKDGRLLSHVVALAMAFKEDDLSKAFLEHKDRPGAMEGRLWHDDVFYYEMAYEDEYAAFSHLCKFGLAERRRVLAHYRALARRVCDGAARLIVTAPDLQAEGEELRGMARALLRNRYYLEGDWRGETPLPDGRLQ